MSSLIRRYPRTTLWWAIILYAIYVTAVVGR